MWKAFVFAVPCRIGSALSAGTEPAGHVALRSGSGRPRFGLREEDDGRPPPAGARLSSGVYDGLARLGRGDRVDRPRDVERVVPPSSALTVTGTSHVFATIAAKHAPAPSAHVVGRERPERAADRALRERGGLCMRRRTCRCRSLGRTGTRDGALLAPRMPKHLLQVARAPEAACRCIRERASRVNGAGRGVGETAAVARSTPRRATLRSGTARRTWQTPGGWIHVDLSRKRPSRRRMRRPRSACARALRFCCPPSTRRCRPRRGRRRCIARGDLYGVRRERGGGREERTEAFGAPRAEDTVGVLPQHCTLPSVMRTQVVSSPTAICCGHAGPATGAALGQRSLHREAPCRARRRSSCPSR